MLVALAVIWGRQTGLIQVYRFYICSPPSPQTGQPQQKASRAHHLQAVLSAHVPLN